jgi:hypothetical protein
LDGQNVGARETVSCPASFDAPSKGAKSVRRMLDIESSDEGGADRAADSAVDEASNRG